MGTRLTFTSSEQGVPLTIDDAANNRVYINYDAAGNVTSRTGRLGRVLRFTFDEIGRLSTETSPRGGVRTNVYNPRGTLSSFSDSQTDPYGWHRFTYDGNDSVVADYMPFAGRSTNYAYDALNHVTTATYGDGTSVHYTRDFRGNKLTEVDEGGHTTTFEYDLAGELVKTTYANGTFAQRDYDGLGRLASTTDERGHTTSYEYDAGCGCSDRTTQVTDALGRATVTVYDAAGRRTSVTDAAGHTTSFAYDVRGHVTDTNYADGTTVHDTFDTRGRRTASTDQTGAVTTYGYDAEGQLTSVTDALEHVTTYAYDADGNLASVTDANGHTTTYEYDLLKRKTKRKLPLGMSETFAYDAVGNEVSHTDFRGKTTTRGYDTRNRLLSKVPDPTLGEPTAAYTYFATGMGSAMTDASGGTSYTYDARNRLLTRAAPAGTLTYTYDPSGNVASIRSSNANGTSVDYAWNADNQLVSVTDNRASGIATAAYTSTGRPATMSLPNGVGMTYGYDSLDRVTSLAWQRSASPPFASWAYTYNGRGQRLTAADLAARHVTYGYDATSRLASETIVHNPPGGLGDGVLTYTLDPVGNRLSRTTTLAALATQTFSYDANDQLTSDDYDPNGNTTNTDGNTYAYDFENRLVSKNTGAGAVTVGGVTTMYLVDDLNPTGYLQVLEEVSGGAVQTRYTYGTSIVSQTRDVPDAPQTRFYGYDAHGNVTFLTDATGAVTDTYEYDAWGNIVAWTGGTPNQRLYVGEEFDPDLGLINLRARYYQVAIGRFFTIDADRSNMVHPLGWNRFGYADVDPVANRDPLGQAALAEYAVAITVAAALVAATTVYIGFRNHKTTELSVAGAAAAVGQVLNCSLWTQWSRFELMAAVAAGRTAEEPPAPFDICEDPCQKPWNRCVESPLFFEWEGPGLRRCAACLFLCEGLEYWPARLTNGHACVWSAD